MKKLLMTFGFILSCSLIVGIGNQSAYAKNNVEKLEESENLEIGTLYEIQNDLNLSDDEIDSDIPLAKTQIRKISDDPNYLKDQQQFKNYSGEINNYSLTDSIFDSITPYGAGKWDYLGSSTFKSQSKTFYSGGGDLLILIEQPYGGLGGPKWAYKLYEEDTLWTPVVSSFELPNKACTYEMKFDVRNWVDGDNKKAELHLSKLFYPTDSVTTYWYD